MILNENLKKILLVIFSTLILSACSTAKNLETLKAMYILEKKQLNI